MIFLNGKSFSLNMIAMARPSAKVDNTLTVGNIKFQIIIWTRGPRSAGLVTKSAKFLNPTTVRNPGLMVFPSFVVNVPSIALYTSPLD